MWILIGCDLSSFSSVSEASYKNKERGVHAIVAIVFLDNLCHNVVLLWSTDKGFLHSGKVHAIVKEPVGLQSSKLEHSLLA